MKISKCLFILLALAVLTALTTSAKAEPIPFDVEPTIEELATWPVRCTGPLWGPVYTQLVEKDGKRAMIIRTTNSGMLVGYSFILKDTDQVKTMELWDFVWTEVTDRLDPGTLEWINYLLRSDTPEKKMHPQNRLNLLRLGGSNDTIISISTLLCVLCLSPRGRSS
jgi:hypothetical protein